MNYLILIDHIIVSGSRFLLSILIARALGLEEFGLYSLLWTIVTLASSMQIPSTITPMMQIGIRISKHRQAKFFATAMLAQLGYSFISLPFISVFATVIVWGRPDALAIVFAINIYVFIFNQFEYFRRYFFAVGHRATALCLDAGLYFLLLVSISGAIKFGEMDITRYLILSSFIGFIFCLFALKFYRFGWIKRDAYIEYRRRIWKVASPLITSTIAGFITGHAFIYVSAYLLGEAEVGGIAAARNIVGPLLILLMALENSLIRDLVLLSNNPERIRAYVRSVTIRWFLTILTCVVILSALARPLLELTYGPEFVQFTSLIYWFGGASLFQILSRIQTVKLRTENKYEAIKRANIGTMILTVPISPLLVWLFGLTGAGMLVVIIAASIWILQDVFDRDGVINKMIGIPSGL